MKIRELGYNKQSGLIGNCINVPIDINKTVTCLPRMDSEDDTVLVQLVRRITDTKPYLYKSVRPELVFENAINLTQKDIYIKHKISLKENGYNSLKLFVNTPSTVFDCSEGANEDQNDTNDIPQNEDELDEVEQQQIIQQQQTLLTNGLNPSLGIKMNPGEGNAPLSLLMDDDLDILSFPSIYGGEQRNFKVKYSPVDIAKAEARSHDRRVAMNIPKLMLNFCKARAYKLKGKVSIGLRKKIKTDNVKVSQILDNNALLI